MTNDGRAAAKLTDRDRDLLGLLAMARYLTAAQVHRLAFPGKNISVTYRRLAKLSSGGAQAGFIRQRFFRNYDGERVTVWAITPHAMSAALARCADLPDLPKHDVGAQFLEHLLQLNELLIALWSNGKACPRAAHPALRWIPSDRVRLLWNEWEVRDGRKQQRVIQPDAVLELTQQRRRFFLECEMGTQPISKGQGNAPGATIAKAERYQTYLAEASAADRRLTHYQAQHPDHFAVEVLFLVLTPGRAASVNTALKSWRATLQGPRPAIIRALTFEAAAAELRHVAGLQGALRPNPAQTAFGGTAPAPKTAIGREEIALLTRYLSDSVRSIKRARGVFRELRREDLPVYPDSYTEVEALLTRLVASHSAR